ncbi:tRNA pseudouridine(55) synthase TruB [Sphingomonas profundi]|uniref:tRNA pseudouridine(55) synthase TruB n=1 Tax=Alterirhizorhabdus profundi TaxID=2681549 RepID=UPI0012E70D90|nr:tRNA pseudouridine(55) synthase TruB [Sphingomonas profundi]
MLHGWIVIDKPVGPGSTQIVSAVKRALRSGGYPKMKVGHGGTLDPLASGVLPVALGEATKLCGRMLDADKGYDFTIAFGAQTDTLDREGPVVATSDVRPTLAEIAAVLPRFTGPIEQVPPIYSALKVDGRRAYDRARAGEDVEMKTRAVKIHALSVSSPPSPFPERSRGALLRDEAEEPTPGLGAGRNGVSTSPEISSDRLDSITLTTRVSKGTYIRSLARDIAIAAGTVGHVAMLRRTKAGPFGLEKAISLDMLAEMGHARGLEDILLPLTAGLDDIPALPVTPDQARALREGRRLIGAAAASGAASGLHMAIDGQGPVALVEVSGLEIRVVRGFNL